MSVEKNETAIQALKIMYAVSSKNTKKKLTKTHYSKPYPKGIEAHYKTMLTNFFRPLVKFVDEFLQENSAALLRGDSVDIRCDAMPGGTFRKMVEQMEGWLAVYMPTVPEMQAGQNNVVFMGLGETADSLKKYEDKQFQKQLQSGIGVQFQTNAPWWAGTKASWAQNNYSLITSNARNYVSQINTLAEQAVVNGLSVNQLQEQIKKASAGLTDKKCRLLARDQIGKLQGQIAQAQMEEVGLEMYVWETSGDERVRGNPNGKYPQASPSHFLMDGLLCRWDDAGVCSKDGGKTWESRPANAVKLHPGQDIQCRCIALVYMPELLFEVSGERVETKNAVEEIAVVSNLISSLTSEQKQVYDSVLKEFKNDKFGVDISYTVATGDFTNLPKEIFASEEWDIILNKISRSLELYDDNLYVLNEFDIVKNLFSKSKKMPRFVCTEKELEDYIAYLKQGKILASYEKMWEKNYGYEKYFAFARKLGTSTAAQKTYYRGLFEYLNLSNNNLSKIAYEQLVDGNRIFRYSNINSIAYFDKCLSTANIKIGTFDIKHFINIQPEVGAPWGTAELANEDYKAIAMFDHKISPFDKATQKFMDIAEIEINSKTASYGIAQKMYCEQNYPLSKKLLGKDIVYEGKKYKYHTDEFLRMEFSFDGKAQNYKVGQVLKQTGVFATSPSELHNSLWYQSKLSDGATNPIRFHLQNNELAHKYLANVITNDLRVAEHTVNNPEEFDFALGKVKIIKIEDGFINNDKNYPVKEIFVEIVE